MIKYEKSNYGEVVVDGIEYQLTQDAYPENYQDETAMFCHATRGETDEWGDEIVYLVRWEYVEADELENCADWDNPVEVTRL